MALDSFLVNYHLKKNIYIYIYNININIYIHIYYDKFCKPYCWYIQGSVIKKCPCFIFLRKPARLKTQQITYKYRNFIGVQYFCVHEQVVSTLSFIFYPPFIFTSSPFLPTFLFPSAYTTNIVPHPTKVDRCIGWTK